MRPYYQDESLTLHQGHVLNVLPDLPKAAAQVCVTSPPYYKKRAYPVPPQAWPAVRFAPMVGMPEVEVPAWTGCLGQELEPMAFIGHLVNVFRSVRWVLSDSGTVWVNMGDGYVTRPNGSVGRTSLGGSKKVHAEWRRVNALRSAGRPLGLKHKQLLGIPWRLGLALQADGWWLRSEVIWHKPNALPGPWKDRPVTDHETVLVLAKSQRYLYDADAVRREAAGRNAHDLTGGRYAPPGQPAHTGSRASGRAPDGRRNLRTVWSICTTPSGVEHSALMPPEVAELPIRAGSCPGDLVLDPFNGGGTTGLVARALGRRYEGVELAEDFCRASVRRWGVAAHLRAPVRRRLRRRRQAAQADLGLETGR